MILGTGGSKEASQLAETALNMVRNISYLLHPPLLDEAGLRPALHWYVDGLAKRSNLEIALSLKPQRFPRLSKDLEVTIFRVIQESLTNIYRHSGSESARVEIEKQADRVIVRVRDYGKGVPAELGSPKGGCWIGCGHQWHEGAHSPTRWRTGYCPCGTRDARGGKHPPFRRSICRLVAAISTNFARELRNAQAGCRMLPVYCRSDSRRRGRAGFSGVRLAS